MNVLFYLLKTAELWYGVEC